MPEKETRPFWFLCGAARELVHRTDADDPRCKPDPARNIGYVDTLAQAEEQGCIPCPRCRPDLNHESGEEVPE